MSRKNGQCSFQWTDSEPAADRRPAIVADSLAARASVRAGPNPWYTFSYILPRQKYNPKHLHAGSSPFALQFAILCEPPTLPLAPWD